MTTVPLPLDHARRATDRAFRLAENYQKIYEHDLYEPMDVNLYEQMIQAARILAHLHRRIYDAWQRAGGTSYAAANPPGLYHQPQYDRHWSDDPKHWANDD